MDYPVIEVTPATVRAWLDTKADDDVVGITNTTDRCLAATFIRERLVALGYPDIRVDCGVLSYNLDRGDSILMRQAFPIVVEFDDLVHSLEKIEITAAQVRRFVSLREVVR